MRQRLCILCLASVSVSLAGCSWLDFCFPGINGPAYTIEGDTLGTGRQAIHLRNDSSYWNGEPMDLRRD